MFKIVFTWDEVACKWDAHVEGAKDETEARQGFSAVVLTCKELPSQLLNKTIITKSGDKHTVTPVVF